MLHSYEASVLAVIPLEHVPDDKPCELKAVTKHVYCVLGCKPVTVLLCVADAAASTKSNSTPSVEHIGFEAVV